MHVCFLNPPAEYYSPVSGGAIATIAMESTRRLIAHGHRVTVMTATNGDEQYSIGDIVPIESPTRDQIPTVPRRLAVLRSRLEGWDLPYYQFYLASFSKALRELKTPPDIVITFNDLVSARYIRAVLPGVKNVVWLQNEQGTRQKSIGKALAAIDRFLTCSSYIRDYHVGRYNIPQQNVTVIHSGVDVDSFKPESNYLTPHKTLRALFIGRIDPNKGPDIAADAVSTLRKEGLDISLTVAGGLWFYGHGKEMEDPYFQSLKVKMDAAGANFVGYVVRPDVPALVRKHDVAFVLSRSNEPFGLVALEAMASGCAVISSNRGGLPEACGGAAIMVDPEDMSAVVASLKLLATDTEALNEWKQRAVTRAGHASWKSVGDKLNSVLKPLAQKNV